MKSKLTITGSAGFIGTHLKNKFKEIFDLVLIDLKEKRYIDLRTIEVSKLTKLIKGSYAVFHLASVSSIWECDKDPEKCYETNVMGTLKLYEACKKAGVERVIMSSTSAIYGADTFYSRSKEAMEDIAKIYYDKYGIKTICLRYANVYGEKFAEQDCMSVIDQFKKDYKEKGKVTIYGDGEQERDFIHVKDILLANICAVNNIDDIGYGIYDICTDVKWKLNDIIKILDIPVEYKKARQGDVKTVELSKFQALEDLNFIATEDFITELKRIWYTKE